MAGRMPAISLYWAGRQPHFGGRPIRAWTVAFDTTSCDASRNDDVLGTFNALFPKGAYFGLMAPMGPYTHMDLHPQLDVTLPRAWSLSANWLWFWRTEVDDGVYGVAGQALRSGRDTHSRFVGQSPGLELTKRLTPHLSLAAQASLFAAGPFIRETQTQPADDIHFVASIATYRF